MMKSAVSKCVLLAANAGPTSSGVKTAAANGLFHVSKRSASGGFDSSRLEIRPASPSQLKEKPPVDQLGFGRVFSDHMLSIPWSAADGWGTPVIEAVRPLQVHPAAKVLHYAQELFEGMKAYRGVDDRVRMFRPMHNMARMNVTARRSCLPTFDGAELLECIRKLVQLDQEWVPHHMSSSLYIRPTLIGTEPTLGVVSASEALLFVLTGPVGPYYSTGAMKPVSLLADPAFVRAFPGGCGFAKMGSNYAPTLWVQKQAEKFDCHQVLWLHGPQREITEVGAMNMFIALRKADGSKELVTPPLGNGLILPGVTRRSIVELAQSWGEFEVSERSIYMDELVQANEEGSLLEVFGSGTAAVVSPVGRIHYEGKFHNLPTPEDGLAHRVMEAMCDIHYGRIAHPWALDVEDWKVDKSQELEDYRVAAEQMERYEGRAATAA